MRRRCGLLPPMAGVTKRIEGADGVTRLGSLGVARFRVVPRPGGAALAYRAPFRGVVDELRPAPDGGWLGTMRVAGMRVGGFEMRRPAAGGRRR